MFSQKPVTRAILWGKSRKNVNEIHFYFIYLKRPKKDEKKEEESQEEEIQDTGPLTLTLLLAKEQREHIFFIHAKTVGEKDVFVSNVTKMLWSYTCRKMHTSDTLTWAKIPFFKFLYCVLLSMYLLQNI